MITVLKSLVQLLRDVRGEQAMKPMAWIIVALIIAVAVVAGVYIYSANQQEPFWETE